MANMLFRGSQQAAGMVEVVVCTQVSVADAEEVDADVDVRGCV